MKLNIAIVGAGVSGTILGALIKKYLNVNISIFEKSIPGLSMSLDKSAIEDNETAISLINDALKSLQSD